MEMIDVLTKLKEIIIPSKCKNINFIIKNKYYVKLSKINKNIKIV